MFEAAVDAFSFAVLERQDALMAKCDQCDDVSWFIRQNVRNFVGERQQIHDPIGHMVFRNTQAALLDALQRGRLSAVQLGGRGQICNATTFTFAPTVEEPSPASAPEVTPAAAPSHEGLLRALLGQDPRWPALTVALVTARASTQAELRACIEALRGRGVRAFRFKELVDAIKADVREHHDAQARALEEPGEAPSDVPQDWAQIETAVHDAIRAYLAHAAEVAGRGSPRER